MLRQECPKIGIGTLTGLFGYSRQSFYNGVKENEFAENAIEPLSGECQGLQERQSGARLCKALLKTVYPLEALRMALSTIDDGTAAMLIHYSDLQI